MLSSAVRVRAATEADLPVLLELGDELRDQVLPVEGRSRAGATMANRAALAQRYCEAINDPTRHLVLAVGGKEGASEVALGMALFTVSTANALVDIPAVHMSHAVVADRHRKRGAGKALVTAAAAYAEEQGIEQLVVSVHPGSRDAARFFARLGFAPQAVRRTAPVTVVRRRLSAGERGVERIVRQTRRRPVRAAVPLGTAESQD
ncbi:MAG: family N-acetyltransferase [Frankiales bacterium]|nr:family N-acetyltransferase [Frankiales bacterium]MCW2706256.1 family N-acetyltransferase [Frankiales bacterium]